MILLKIQQFLTVQNYKKDPDYAYLCLYLSDLSVRFKRELIPANIDGKYVEKAIAFRQALRAPD